MYFEINLKCVAPIAEPRVLIEKQETVSYTHMYMVCGDKLEVPSSMAGPGELIEKQETVSKSQSSRVPVPKQVAQVARHDARVEQLDDGQ